MTRRPQGALLRSAALAAALVAAACGEEEARPGTAPGSAAETGAGPTGAAPDAPGVAPAAAAPGALAAGQHSVLGLRIPNGMAPASSPSPGVYRFEGPQPPEIAARVLEAQLASFEPPATEPGATLYRRAVVREPAGGAGRIPLAIRVHRRESGSAVDVWREPATAAGGPAAGQPAAWADPLGGEPKGPPTYGSREERRRAVHEMLGKVSRGEPLTPEDMDNPLFQ